MYVHAGLEFYESSAKENINVTPIFERLVDLICDKMSKSLDSNATVLNNPQTKRLPGGPGGPGGIPGIPGGFHLGSLPGGQAVPNLMAQCQKC